jgi:outer membrane protein
VTYPETPDKQSTQPGDLEFAANRLGAYRKLMLKLCMLLAFAGLGGCAASAERPELNPSRWAPPAVQHEWQLGPNERALELQAGAGGFDSNRPTPPALAKYDLPALIDLALNRNPETREAWEEARAAAAEWGISRAPFYPTVRTDSQNGYERSLDLVPKHWGTLKNWSSIDRLTLYYDLADFGRRDAAARSAREQTLAANLHFNREIQQVVFSVEKSFYLLDAERSNVAAAEAIMRLATNDRIAVEKSRAAGLATKPDVLLASQREARARFELENAELGVSDAQADLALAIGVRVDKLPEIESFGGQTVPATLGGAVNNMIDLALRERPDLAARVAALRSDDAAVDLARAALYPTVEFSSYYGSHAFNYRLSNPPTPQFTAMVPEYAASVALRWDAFAGFEHVNSIERAKANREADRARVYRYQLEVADQVWRAYYAFATALRKYQYALALLRASQSAYYSNFGSFKGGLATIVDLLSAERDLADAKYTMVGSRADLLIAAAAVAYATGAIPAQARP